MVATITLRVFTGLNAATMSAAVTGIDLISADNAVNSPANRLANPVLAGTRSYEKWLKAYVDVAPDNYCKNFLVWGDGFVGLLTVLGIGKTAIGATPTDADSIVALDNFVSYEVGTEFAWHAGELVNPGDMTDFLVLQLFVGSAHAPGAWAQETIHYSWVEA